MRNKRIVAAVTGVALTGVVASGTIAASSALAAPPAGHLSHSTRLAAPDPSSVLATTGQTGDVLSAVGKLAAMAKSGAPKPSAGAVTAAVKAVTDAVAKVGVPVKAAKVPVATAAAAGHRDLPVPLPVSPPSVPGAPALPGVGSLKDAAAKVAADAKALGAALTSGDLTKIAAALTKLATDTVALLTATIASVGGVPKV